MYLGFPSIRLVITEAAAAVTATEQVVEAVERHLDHLLHNVSG